MKKQIPVLCACLLLFGCAETPSEVQEEISRLDADRSSQAEERSTVQPVPVASLQDDADAVLRAQSGNYVIECAFVPHTDRICSYQLTPKRTNPDTGRFRQTCQKLLGTAPDAAQISSYSEDIALTDQAVLGPDTDSTAISAMQLVFPVRTLNWRTEDEKPSVSMSDRSAVSFSRGFDMIVSPYLLDTVKVDAVLRDGAWADTARTMYDGTEWRASDCAQYAAEIFAELAPDSFFTWQPFRITVRQIGERCGYWVLMQRVAPDGVPVYPFSGLNRSSGNAVTDFPLRDYSWCWCVRENEVQELSMAQDYEAAGQNALDALLPLSAAKRIAEQALAAQRTYHVSARLCHCIKLYGSKVSEIVGYQLLEAPDYSDYDRIMLEPYWIFTESDGEDETRYMVNAQTGAFEIR